MCKWKDTPPSSSLRVGYLESEPTTKMERKKKEETLSWYHHLSIPSVIVKGALLSSAELFLHPRRPRFAPQRRCYF
jgi:hypothetical protein